VLNDTSVLDDWELRPVFTVSCFTALKQSDQARKTDMKTERQKYIRIKYIYSFSSIFHSLPESLPFHAYPLINNQSIQNALSPPHSSNPCPLQLFSISYPTQVSFFILSHDQRCEIEIRHSNTSYPALRLRSYTTLFLRYLCVTLGS
jgi:hypothetical protein